MAARDLSAEPAEAFSLRSSLPIPNGMRTRLSPPFAALLSLTIVLALSYIGFLAVQSHRRAERAASYRQGERALHAMVLPPSLVDEAHRSGGVGFGCRPAPDTRCLHTRVMTKNIDPILRRLLEGAHDVCIVQTNPCAVYGQIGGQDAFALAFPHVSIAKNSRVPHGAIPGRDGRYILGTDITLGLAQ